MSRAVRRSQKRKERIYRKNLAGEKIKKGGFTLRQNKGLNDSVSEGKRRVALSSAQERQIEVKE